jgi:uncharacterized protein YjbI with pentapeptide repeats
VADEEAVARLRRGVLEWNAWREAHPDADADLIWANLSDANLTGANLTGAELSGAKLSKAGLSHATLIRAHLRDADLRDAYLARANLTGATLIRAHLRDADLRDAHLRDANLTGANLTGAHLTAADLRDAYLARANLFGAILFGADLRDVNLTGANLRDANLTRANLTSANLTGADLTGANLRDANLNGANLTDVHLLETIFGNVNLTGAIGLETCRHRGPSTIDHRTLQRSGTLPLAFLRGVGLPDNLIEYLPALFNQAIQHYSCFISYSAKDQDFAERLHADLQGRGVRCWFAPHDLRIGKKILDEIDAAIRLRDRVLLILSEHAINSDWVEDEVTAGFEEERKRGEEVLFPVRLDDTVMTMRRGRRSFARALSATSRAGRITTPTSRASSAWCAI